MALEHDPEQDLGFGESSPYAAHLDRGWSLLDQGNARGARSSGEQAHKALPDDPDACLLLAAAAQQEGLNDEAVDWYEKAIEIDPDYPEPYLSASQILLYDLSKPEEAQALLFAAQEIDDLLAMERAEISILLADCAHLSEQAENALHTLQSCRATRQLCQLFPEQESQGAEDLKALVAELCRFAGIEEPEAQELDDEEVETMMRRMAIQCFRVARLFAELSQSDVAAELMKRVLVHMPDQADLWHLLSDCEYRLGNLREAMQASFRVQTLDAQEPSSPGMWSDETLLGEVASLYAQVVSQPELAPIEECLDLQMALLDRPSLELLYEGLDPRALFLILRPHVEDACAPHPATLIVYRQNIARLIEPGDTRLSEEVAEYLEESLLTQLQADAPSRLRQRTSIPSGAMSEATDPPKGATKGSPAGNGNPSLRPESPPNAAKDAGKLSGRKN